MSVYDVDTETAASLKLWVVLHRARRSIQGHLQEQVASHGLSLTEFAVLEVLLHKGALRIGEIGERVLLSSGSMTYVVDKLVKRGLIDRRLCEEDRRVTYAELTPEGQRLIKTVFAEHASVMRKIMEGLSLEEKQTAIALFKKLGRYAAEVTPEAADR